MNESEFKRFMALAKLTNSDYSRGYQRGLQRHYHGENFGTEDEHEQWQGLSGHRAEMGRGYRDGFAGIEPMPENRTGMRSTVIIKKRGEGYVSTVTGQFGGGHTGARAGLTPYDAAATAAELMIRYAQNNDAGGDLMAPPEIMELVPTYLRSIDAKWAIN